MSNFRVTTSRRGGRSFHDHDDRTVTSYEDQGYGDRGGYRGRGGRGSRRPYRGGSNPYKWTRGGGSGRGMQNDLDRLRSSRGAPRGRRGGGYRGGGGGPGRGRSSGGDGVNPLSRLEDDEGDIDMDGAGGGRSRSTPYDRPARRDYGSGDRGRIQRLGFPVGGSDRFSSPQPDDQWFRIIIPYGKNAQKDWILQSITNVCEEPFVPKSFTHEGKNAMFYVQGRAAALAIKRCSRKITMPNGFQMVIEMSPARRAPQTHDLDEESVEKLKVVMSNRYDPAAKSLDLSDLFHDPELNKEGLHLPLSRVSVMSKVIEIIENHIPELEKLQANNNRLFSLDSFSKLTSKAPNIKSLSLKNNELKSDRELDVLKKLPLEELDLDGNPLCERFDEPRAYVSAIRKKFPNVINLDGHALPPPIKFELDAETPLPAAKGSHFGNDQVKDLVCEFLTTYYQFFDGDKRESLLDAYHDNAAFSFSWFFNDLVTYKQGKGFNAYPPESRNMIKVHDSYRRGKALKTGKLNIVALLTQLPRTQHDPASLLIDVTRTQTPDSLLAFSVTGVYKETETKSDYAPLRAFTRSFVTVPQGSGIVIINEELTITNPTQEQVKKSFRTPAPTPSSSPVLGAGSAGVAEAAGNGASDSLTPLQQQMVTSFAQQSGMNNQWTTKCLSQNDWDYDKAAKVFTELQAAGSIPQEAYVK